MTKNIVHVLIVFLLASIQYTNADVVYDLPLVYDYSISPDQPYYEEGDIISVTANVSIDFNHRDYDPDIEYHLTSFTINALVDRFNVISCNLDQPALLNTTNPSYTMTLSASIVETTSWLWLAIDAWEVCYDREIQRQIENGEVDGNDPRVQWDLEHLYYQCLEIEKLNPPLPQNIAPKKKQSLFLELEENSRTEYKLMNNNELKFRFSCCDENCTYSAITCANDNNYSPAIDTNVDSPHSEGNLISIHSLDNIGEGATITAVCNRHGSDLSVDFTIIDEIDINLSILYQNDIGYGYGNPLGKLNLFKCNDYN